MKRVSGSGGIGDVRWARTATRIRRNSGNENEKEYPNLRRRMVLFMLMYWCLTAYGICVRERIDTWPTGLSAEPLFRDLIKSRRIMIVALQATGV